MKTFRIVRNNLSKEAENAYHPLRWRIEQRHTILFFIHWWSTPDFEPPHNFEFSFEASSAIMEHFPKCNYKRIVIMKASEFELLQKAISVYGAVAQTDMAIEEMGELIVAINHYRRGRVGMDAVKEEIADVMIAMKQLAMIYGEAGVEIFSEKKMQRLEQRLTIHEAKYKENQNNPKKASALAARLEAMQKQVEEMQKQRMIQDFNV